jgi:hypothetical protein
MNLPADNRAAPPAPPSPHGRPLRLTVPIQALNSAILQVVVVWRGRIIGYQLLDKRRRVTIGEHKSATFLTPTADGRRKFVLLKPRRGGYQLRLAPGMRGEVQVGAGTSDVLDLLAQPAMGRSKSPVREVPLSSGDRAKLHFDGNPDLRIEVRWVDPPELLAKPKVEDPQMFQTLVGTAIVLGLAAAGLWFSYSPPEKPLELTAQRIAKIEEPILQLEKKQSARRAKEKQEKEEKKKQEEGQMKRAKEKAGKLGKEDAPTKETVIAKGEKDVLREKVSKVGLLGLVGKERPQGSGLSKLFAEDTSVEQAVAGMAGARTVAGRGNGGLSTAGTGPGGGGTGFGHIYGAGNLDTGGRGARGKGRGPKLAERGEREVSVGVGGGGGDADGSLSKEQINKVVRAHLAGVKYCYEKELQHKSGLSGGVDIFWVIQPDGSVSKASVKSTTLSDASVEGCILRQVKQWQFPKAAGQTIVGRYPFIFKGGS